jgi:hypothetical protein
MKQEELQKLQQELDVNKWADGQVKGADPCGSYDYCAKCDKAVEYPCATAKTAFEAPAKKAIKKCAPKDKSVKAPAVETKVEAKPVVKAETKPEVKVEVKAEAKPEVKTEVKEVKAEVKAVKAPVKKGKKCR